ACPRCDVFDCCILRRGTQRQQDRVCPRLAPREQITERAVGLNESCGPVSSACAAAKPLELPTVSALQAFGQRRKPLSKKVTMYLQEAFLKPLSHKIWRYVDNAAAIHQDLLALDARDEGIELISRDVKLAREHHGVGRRHSGAVLDAR